MWRPHSGHEGSGQNGSSAANIAAGTCDVELDRTPRASFSRERCTGIDPTECGLTPSTTQPYPNALADEASAVLGEQAAGHTGSAPSLNNVAPVGCNDMSWADINERMEGLPSVQIIEEDEDSNLLVGVVAGSWPARQIDAGSEDETFSQSSG